MTSDNQVLNFYRASAEDFKKIPGSPLAYWVGNKVFSVFKESKKLGELAEVKHGMSTGNNAEVVRLWGEISYRDFGIDFQNRNDALNSKKKWFPYNKGGDFRKWYGNCEYVLRYDKFGNRIMNSFSGHRHDGKSHYFFEGVSWTFISSSRFAARYTPPGFVFDVSGSSLFIETPKIFTGFLCSKLCYFILTALNPTLNFQVGNLKSLPILIEEVQRSHENLLSVSSRAIDYSKSDWDSYETSWDFTTLPLLKVPYRSSELKKSWYRLRSHWIKNTLEMQRLEEENNRIFISAYGLEDELTPDVPLEEITLTCNPYYRYGNKVDETETSTPPSGMAVDSAWPWNNALENRLLADTMKELLSYAVGCIFGRYSLDKEGLVLANAGEGLDEYLPLVPEPAFMPDESGILPLTEEDDFTDDLPTQVKHFIKTALGPDNFDANIRFIEDAIGRDIRSYLLKEFYKDHIQRYKKRPIYWMATSTKGTFRVLFYLHRYTPDTVGRLLNDYVRPFMKKLSNKIENDLHQLSFGSLSRGEAARTQKRIDKHREALKEIEGWEKKVYETATRRIELDLDDGVKVNYGKLIDILEPVKGLDS